MLLRHEILTDLPENCKEAARQICFNLFLQILYNFQQGDQWQERLEIPQLQDYSPFLLKLL